MNSAFYGRIARSGGAIAIILMLLAAAPLEARADGHRSFAMAGRQWLLIERMTNSALLAALEVAASPSMNSVHWSRDRFDRTHSELLTEDRQSPGRPEIVTALDRVDSQWRQYDRIFSEIAGAGRISSDQIRSLTDSHAATVDALGQMVDAYQFYVHGGSSHSILSATIDEAGKLRAHTQSVLRALLMVAYTESEPDRQRLIQSTQEFNRILMGLIHGDGDLRLLPAPTREIRDELMKVDRMWKEALPVLEAAARGNAVTNDQIAAVAQYSNDMAVPLTMALLMYLSL